MSILTALVSWEEHALITATLGVLADPFATVDYSDI